MLNKSTYLLVCLIEECAAIIQRVCKAIRFGFDEVQPGQDANNIDRIAGEVNDFMGVARMLENRGVSVLQFNEEAIEQKVLKVHSFMPLSRERGMLEPEKSTALTRADLARMKPSEIADLDWAEVRRVLSQ